MQLGEFLEWERGQDNRYEFDGEHPVAMTKDTAIHDMVAADLATALNERLRDNQGKAIARSQQLILRDRVRYPDLVVMRARPETASGPVAEPTVVVEILSPETDRTDRYDKFREYDRTPSIQHYLQLEQEAPEVFC